jgi:hypothetical protein
MDEDKFIHSIPVDVLQYHSRIPIITRNVPNYFKAVFEAISITVIFILRSSSGFRVAKRKLIGQNRLGLVTDSLLRGHLPPSTPSI